MRIVRILIGMPIALPLVLILWAGIWIGSAISEAINWLLDRVPFPDDPYPRSMVLPPAPSDYHRRGPTL